MLEPEVMQKFWPPLVRDVVLCTTYPGYRYEFFQRFADLDAYFSDLCGADWAQQPWAEYWIGQHNASRAAFRRELAARRGEQNGFHAYGKIDDATFLALVARARQDNVRLSQRQLSRYLRECGYGISPRTVLRLLHRHSITDRTKGARCSC